MPAAVTAIPVSSQMASDLRRASRRRDRPRLEKAQEPRADPAGSTVPARAAWPWVLAAGGAAWLAGYGVSL